MKFSYYSIAGKSLLILTTIIVLGKLCPNAVQAITTTSIDLSVSPPVNYVSIKPGETKSYEIRLENPGETTLEIVPSLLDFEADDRSGRPIVKKTGTFPYLKLNHGALNFGSSFTLEAQQKLKLIINLEIPKTAPEEEFTMTIFFSFKNKIDLNMPNTQAKVSGTVGSNLILLVTRNLSDRGEIQLKSISTWPTIDSFMPIQFKVLAENIGQNATAASGSATILDWHDQKLAEFTIYPDMILAGSSRELRENELISTEFRFKKPWLLGLYKIKIDLRKNSQLSTETVSLTKTIVALPITITLLPLIGYTLYYFYRTLLDKTKSKKKNENHIEQ